MISGHAVEEIIGNARKRLTGQMHALVNPVADDIRVSGEGAIGDDRQRIVASRRTHDGYRGAHGATKHADARPRQPTVGVVERGEKVVHLAEAERYRDTEVAAMTAIVEEEHIEARTPEHGPDTNQQGPAGWYRDHA